MPPSMLLAEARDALVIDDELAGELNRGGDQKPVGRVAAFERVGADRCERRPDIRAEPLRRWALKKALHPRLDRTIEVDPPRVDEERDLPCADGAYGFR